MVGSRFNKKEQTERVLYILDLESGTQKDHEDQNFYIHIPSMFWSDCHKKCFLTEVGPSTNKHQAVCLSQLMVVVVIYLPHSLNRTCK